MAANVRRRLLILLFGVLLLLPVRPAMAVAAPPGDNFADATVISSVPFSGQGNLEGATTEPNEPQYCLFFAQTVWYAFTPAVSAAVRADATGSAPGVNVNVYQASTGGIGGLTFIGCTAYGGPQEFTAVAGTTYYLQAGSSSTGAAGLHLDLQVIPPPVNDAFSSATPVAALPFTDGIDTGNATLETAEPTPSCGYGPLAGSAWYVLTPAASGSVSASANGPFASALAAYSGGSLGTLTDLGCRQYGGMLTIHVDAGTTYHFQVGGMFGNRGPITINLNVTPPPVPSFYVNPGDPSSFDTVQFYDASYDPGQVGIQSEAWSFGDGTTATGCCQTHRYAADADYTAGLTITTFDGRTGSMTQVVHVKTHDVAVAKLAAPYTARVGRTSRITAQVSDTRYAERVQVQLFKSAPGSYDGFQLVGTLTQSIPAQPKAQATPFDFDYTFTADDGAVGKVTFKVVATIVDARDALPADNTMIAPLTKVTA